jgi:hypothetical protein
MKPEFKPQSHQKKKKKKVTQEFWQKLEHLSAAAAASVY